MAEAKPALAIIGLIYKGRNTMGTRKGYVMLFDSFEEKVFLVFDYGRIDITSLIDIQTINKDMKARTAEITASISVMLVEEE